MVKLPWKPDLEGAKEWCLINLEVMEVIMNSSVVRMKSFSCIKKIYFTEAYPQKPVACEYLRLQEKAAVLSASKIDRRCRRRAPYMRMRS